MVCANLPFRDTRTRVEVPLMYSLSVLSENISVQLELGKWQRNVIEQKYGEAHYEGKLKAIIHGK